MFHYLEELFKYYFGDYGKLEENSRTKHPPPPSTHHHVGTEEFPYRVIHTDKQRRHAIKAGIKEFQEVLMTSVDERNALNMAVNAKRKRLLLIRTLHRNKASCHILHSDVMWLYSYYKLDTSALKFECSIESIPSALHGRVARIRKRKS